MFLITLILLLQFNSFFSVFLVLSAVVMSSIGVMFGLLILQQPFGIVMTGIGIIALAGIIVNNNIVLIDTYDHLKKTAKSRREALLVTGVQRLRPVILTKLTTVLGLLPLVFHMTIDFTARDITFDAPSTQWWAPLAAAITFGVLFASPLTLLFTPCALELQGRFYDWLARRRGGVQAGRTGAGAGRIGYFIPLTMAWPATAQDDIDAAEPGLLQPAAGAPPTVDGWSMRIVVRIAEIVPSQLAQFVEHAEVAALLQRPLGDRALICLRRHREIRPATSAA